MITMLMFAVFFALVNFIITLLPDLAITNNVYSISSLFSLLEKAFIVFPYDVFQLCVINISIWLGIQIIWAIIEWVYKKIPGVN